MDTEFPGSDPRLRIVVELVPPRSRVADIGTDHGRLPRWLLSGGRAAHCIATERTARRLESVRGFGPGHPLAGLLELRWGDGLEPLTGADPVDVVTITGLGGRSIVRILDRIGGGRPRRLVLQPQSEAAELRRWLFDHDWCLVDERLALSRGRFYVALAAERGAGCAPPAHPSLGTQDLLAAGPYLLRGPDPLLRPFWHGQERRLARIVARRRDAGGMSRARARHEQARRILRVLDSA